MSNELIFKSIEELKPYENNPRRNDSAVDAVASSIKEFGFKVPIVIDQDGVIVAGHTRYKASQKLGLERVPCIIADDLTEDQIKAFRLADNKTNELAGWDFAMLEQELESIEGLDMSAFGFENLADIDIDDLFVEQDGEPKEKEPKQIQCPHCGEWFTA